MDKHTPPPSITAGRVSLHQRADGIAIRHHGKSGEVEVLIDVGKLERWAMRTLRDEMFAPAGQAA